MSIKKYVIALAAIVIVGLGAESALAQQSVGPAFVYPFVGGGGSVASGSAVSGCTSSILTASAASLLACDPASVVNGSVSTAGRSILTIRDTISGSSATSNFLNITGTFPATLSAAAYGVYLNFTGDNDVGGVPQRGIYSKLTATATTTGEHAAVFGEFAGSVTNSLSAGVWGKATGTGTYSWGTIGDSRVDTTVTQGAVLGLAWAGNQVSSLAGGYFVSGSNGTPTLSVGAIGLGDTVSTNGAGLYAAFSAYDGGNPGLSGLFTGKAALIADNTSVAANIFEARDNGTAVFTIADGGLATASTGLNITGAASFTAPQLAVSTATTTGFGWNTSDLNHYYASAGAGFLEIGPNAGAQGIAIKRNANCNSNATSCGYNFSAGPGNSVDAFFTSEAAATFQLGFDVNGAAIAQTLKAADGITGTDVAGSNMILAGGRGTGAGAGGNLVLQTSPTLGTGTTAQTLQQRDTIVAKQFNLTSGAIATFAVATLGNDTHAGGSIEYCVYGADATTAVSECGRADYSAIDVTAGAGGEVCTFTKVGTPAQALSGATLTVAFTGTTGTDLCSLRVTSTITTIASPVNHYIKYRIINNGLSSTNIVTPQ